MSKQVIFESVKYLVDQLIKKYANQNKTSENELTSKEFGQLLKAVNQHSRRGKIVYNTLNKLLKVHIPSRGLKRGVRSSTLDVLASAYYQSEKIFSDFKNDSRNIIHFKNADDTESLKLMILPFDTPGFMSSEKDFSSVFLRRYKQISREYELQLQPFETDKIETRGKIEYEVRAAGIDLQVDILIWGQYYKDTDKINFRYEVLDSGDQRIVSSYQTGNIPVPNIEDLEQGAFQGELDYSIYWLCALRAYHAGKDQEALRLLELVQEKYQKKDPELFFRLGLLHQLFHNYQQSLKYYVLALQEGPDLETKAKIYNNQAIINIYTKKGRSVKSQFKNAQKLAPENKTIQRNLALLDDDYWNDLLFTITFIKGTIKDAKSGHSFKLGDRINAIDIIEVGHEETTISLLNNEEGHEFSIQANTKTKGSVKQLAIANTPIKALRGERKFYLPEALKEFIIEKKLLILDTFHIYIAMDKYPNTKEQYFELRSKRHGNIRLHFKDNQLILKKDQLKIVQDEISEERKWKLFYVNPNAAPEYFGTLSTVLVNSALLHKRMSLIQEHFSLQGLPNEIIRNLIIYHLENNYGAVDENSINLWLNEIT